MVRWYSQTLELNVLLQIYMDKFPCCRHGAGIADVVHRSGRHNRSSRPRHTHPTIAAKLPRRRPVEMV